MPGVEFERYADDIVIHTMSMKQSVYVLDKLRERLVSLSVYQLASKLAPKLRGWINYNGSVRKSALSHFFDRLNIRLARWVACKFKITSKWNGFAWLIRISKMQPTLFEHWKYGWLSLVCYEEPYDGRLSSTVLREAGAEMPRPTRQITDSGTFLEIFPFPDLLCIYIIKS